MQLNFKWIFHLIIKFIKDYLLSKTKNSLISQHKYNTKYSPLEKRTIVDEYNKIKDFKEIWNKFKVPKSTLFNFIKADRNKRISGLNACFKI